MDVAPYMWDAIGSLSEAMLRAPYGANNIIFAIYMHIYMHYLCNIFAQNVDVTFLLTFTGVERLSQKPTVVH